MEKLIIFDCDGTLVDSEEISSRVSAELLTQLGYPLTPGENARKFTGLCDKQVRDLIQKETGLEVSKSFMDKVQETIMTCLQNELSPLLLPVLSEDWVQKTPKCVASSSPRSRVLLSLKVSEQKTFFKQEHIYTASQVAHAKPAPDLFLYAAKEMGYAPQDCLVIEDSVAGIQAAKSANMPVIAFLGGAHAQFDWYRQRIQAQEVPIARTCTELLSLMEAAYQKAA